MRNFQRGFFFISVFSGLFFMGLPAGPVFASDVRTEALDMFVIIDGSSALSGGEDAAMGWLCDYAVDGILRDGDQLTIWLASDPARELFSGPLSGADSKETVKSLIRSVTPRGDAADYAGALKAAAGKEAAAKGLTYTLIVCGSRAGYVPFPRTKEEADLLRYSRIADFAGWRVFAVSQAIGSRVRLAAAAVVDSFAD
ncbi:MAG: hypothetical protein LBH57_03525 [Treponema sp.]|jgi:hypothetical protein|nr:hypothetical protein [Treponema sp.]